jgi:hypothetical protein
MDIERRAESAHLEASDSVALEHPIAASDTHLVEVAGSEADR